jgi:hypothetical protein
VAVGCTLVKTIDINDPGVSRLKLRHPPPIIHCIAWQDAWIVARKKEEGKKSFASRTACLLYIVTTITSSPIIIPSFSNSSPLTV